MTENKIGIIINGVTGRMGTNQHLIRSLLAIIEQGGLKTTEGHIIIPDPMLMGRNEAKLKALAAAHGLSRYSTDLDAWLADPYNQIYFDTQLTSLRVDAVRKAIVALSRPARGRARRALCPPHSWRLSADARAPLHDRSRSRARPPEPSVRRRSRRRSP